MSIQLMIVCLYVVLLFAISFYVKHRANKNPMEYLFAGRKLSTSLIAFNVTGLAVGAASTVGVAENATQVGIAAGWYNGAWAIGAVVMGILAAGKYRQMGCSTIPELFERYYDKKGRLISYFASICSRRGNFINTYARYIFYENRYDNECYSFHWYHCCGRIVVFWYV